MAYNEERNIGNLLGLLQHEKSIDEVVVVASGCTDRTVEIATPYSRVITQDNREGKASAINLFIKEAKGDTLILESADTLPLPGSISRLLEPLGNPAVGAVGGRPIPMNSGSTLAEHIVNLIWDLHHLVSVKHPKIGEVIAFRRVFSKIPDYTLTDEACIEAVVRSQGYQVVYAPDAVFQNKGPQTMQDLIKQRRRVHLGHLYLKSDLGFEVSTLSPFTTLHLILKHGYLFRSPIGTTAAMFTEWYCRRLASRDHKKNKQHNGVWDIVESTKELVK
jgi:cellulose synthase/poly-beta-1,6-N-acetylglucosamine synthase-like glycosyltransferase